MKTDSKDQIKRWTPEDSITRIIEGINQGERYEALGMCQISNFRR